MGLFDRYRTDVARVGAEVSAILGGTLEPPEGSDVRYAVRGRRGTREVRVELNVMHGVHSVACTIRPLRLERLTIIDDRSVFAGRSPYITERLRVRSYFDGPALWALLPTEVREEIVEMLARESSDLELRPGEVCVALGPPATLRAPDAASRIVADLDRLMAWATVIEAHWDVDPTTVGTGTMPVVAEPEPPVAPREVRPGDPVAIAAAAGPARDDFVAMRAASLLHDPFPTIDPIRGDRSLVKDKIVVFDAPPQAQWLSDLPARAIPFGDDLRGWYFQRDTEAGLARVLRAVERYQQATGASLADAPYQLVARINGNPRMVIVAGDVKIGLDLETLGALVGDRVFVDASAVDGDDARYAGEPA